MSKEKHPIRSATISISIDLRLEQSAAFDVIVEELTDALARREIEFQPGLEGRLTSKRFTIGKILAWKPGEQILLQWHPADWQPEVESEVELRFTPSPTGTHVILESRGCEVLIDSDEELAAWFAGELLAPALGAIGPTSLGDWLTDRAARRPSGGQARTIYRDPLYHYPNFGALLEELALTADDYLLEVGCGGGALLKRALQSGCRAAAVDHSPEMVRLARLENRSAVAEGRLEIRQADAARLPFSDEAFTCATMTGVLGFLSEPVTALQEIRRVLCDGGRFVMLGSDPELRGTPAAPEPMASRLRFYDERELEELGRSAGFQDVRVVRRELERFAREAGVPAEHMPLFRGPGARFLLARK